MRKINKKLQARGEIVFFCVCVGQIMKVNLEFKFKIIHNFEKEPLF